MKVTQIKKTDSSIQISANVSFTFIAQREGQERAIVSVDVKHHVYLLADVCAAGAAVCFHVINRLVCSFRT